MITLIVDEGKNQIGVELFQELSLAWIVQSTSEENAIREWLIPRLENRSSPVIAISVTAITASYGLADSMGRMYCDAHIAFEK